MNYNSYYNITYQKIMEQVDQEKQYHFGSKANILILTDRLMGYADGIYDFLSLHDDLTVSSARSLADVKHCISQHTPDILLIVGYLADPQLYEAITFVQQANPFVCTVIYARPDDYIASHKLYYHIEFMFSREKPLKNLILFLKDILHQKELEKNKPKKPDCTPVSSQKTKKKNIFKRLFLYLSSKKRSMSY